MVSLRYKMKRNLIPQLTVSYILAFVSVNFYIVLSTTMLCYDNRDFQNTTN